MGNLRKELEEAVPTLVGAAEKKRLSKPPQRVSSVVHIPRIKPKSPQQPARSVTECYDLFCQNMKDVRVRDPLGREIVFRAENFPHLVKVEYLNKARKWVAANASVIIRGLESGTLDEAAHRCDRIRSLGFLRIPAILKAPDSIHENIHPRVSGECVYVVQAEVGTYILAFTTRNWAREWVVVTSYFVSENYLKTCAKQPAIYVKPKGPPIG